MLGISSYEIFDITEISLIDIFQIYQILALSVKVCIKMLRKRGDVQFLASIYNNMLKSIHKNAKRSLTHKTNTKKTFCR